MKTIAGVFLLFMFVCPAKSSAQFFSTDDKLKDEMFLREVKVIDEFIERFNDEKTSFIRKEYQKQNRAYDLPRKEIFISLFNLDNPQWNKNTYLEEFFHDVSDSLHPPHLSFTDTNWYSEASCTFAYNKKNIEIPLILQIQVAKNHGAKWMIAGIGDNPVFSSASSSIQDPESHKAKEGFKFSATSSYATNFVELRNTFADKKDILDYFEPSLLATDRAKQFINLLLQDKLDFKYVKDIKFHFYQLPNWIFVVEQFDRKSLNSGWLINDVKKVPESEKEVAKKQLMQR